MQKSSGQWLVASGQFRTQVGVQRAEAEPINNSVSV